MIRKLCRIVLSAITISCLATQSHAVVVVAEDFFYDEPTKDILNLAGFTIQSYGGGQSGSGGVWNNRWVAVGGTTIVGDDATTPTLDVNPHTAVVTEVATAASLQRNYVPTGAASGASTVYFAGDFKVDDVTVPNIFAEFGLLSPAATLDLPSVSFGITDSEGLASATFFAKIGSTVVTGDPAANANDAVVSEMTHRIVGKLETNVGPAVGDYNSNGSVDAADYVVWRKNLNTAFALPNRDPANTGNVSQADYETWRSAFGRSGTDRLTVYFDPTGVEQSSATVLTAEAEVIGSFGDGSQQTIATLNGDAVPGDSGRPHYIDNLAIGTTWADVATVSVPRLTLEVNTTNGQARLINNTNQAIDLAYYEILSESDALNPTGWNSLDDQNVSGGAWLENNPAADQLIESNFPGSTSIAGSGGTLSLGNAFNSGGMQDLVARWGTKQGAAGLLNVANVVYVAAATTAAVPEPATWSLLLLGMAVAVGARKRFAI
jgi:hypothetical protein